MSSSVKPKKAVGHCACACACAVFSILQVAIFTSAPAWCAQTLRVPEFVGGRGSGPGV